VSTKEHDLFLEQEKTKPTIAIICRLNQARSIFVAAYLSRVLPEFNIISAGIQAVDGQQIPLQIKLLANNWGLTVTKDFSQNITSIDTELLQAEFTIVAENAFADNLIKLGVSPSKIASMQDANFDLNQIPIDPINLDIDSFEVELAKAVMVSVQLVHRRNLTSSRNRITIIHPDSETDFQSCLQRVVEEARESQANVLVADFRFPHVQTIEKMLLPYQEFTISKSSGAITTNQSQLDLALPSLIATKYEIDFVEEFILSANFLELLEVLSKDRPVYVITGQFNSNHRKFSDPYLIAGHNYSK
jgi:protein-tyrosine-phosphatase